MRVAFSQVVRAQESPATKPAAPPYPPPAELWTGHHQTHKRPAPCVASRGALLPGSGLCDLWSSPHQHGHRERCVLKSLNWRRQLRGKPAAEPFSCQGRINGIHQQHPTDHNQATAPPTQRQRQHHKQTGDQAPPATKTAARG